MSTHSTFSAALIAGGPAAEHAEALMLYGQFVGDWTTQTRAFLPDGRVEHSRWDVRFDWVLEGRAIQDVWISPPRAEAQPGWGDPGNRYSTTLRIFEPATDSWQIIWINPPSGAILRQVARREGDEIVQNAAPDENGLLSRWVYRDIGRDTFRWCSEVSQDEGRSWRLIQEMLARRTGGPGA